MKVIVCGGRDFLGRDAVFDQLNCLCDAGGQAAAFTLVVHGDCPTGADASAEAWAQSRGIPTAKYPADWSQGRSAGPRRNQAMLESGASLCVAFPGGRGTADMTNRARKRGLTVVTIHWEPTRKHEGRWVVTTARPLFATEEKEETGPWERANSRS